MDKRFDAVDKRIGQLETELKERLARLEGYFEAMGLAERPIRKRTAN